LGNGLDNPFGLRVLRARHPHVPPIVDAGVGLPSHIAAAMELGYDAARRDSAIGADASDDVASIANDVTFDSDPKAPTHQGVAATRAP
jgi:thiazole synthase